MSQHIAVYLRVSSKSQDAKSQEPDLKRWVDVHVGNVPVRVYRDKFTGKTMDRPAWNRLERALRAREVTQVVVWRLDRLGRTAAGLTALFVELCDLNVNLVSLRDGLDLSTAAGRLTANVLASVAQFEREVLTERTLAGQAVARAQGKRWGGSEKGRLIKVTPEQVQAVERMAREGVPKTAMAKATGLSRPTIYRLLSRQEVASK